MPRTIVITGRAVEYMPTEMPSMIVVAGPICVREAIARVGL